MIRIMLEINRTDNKDWLKNEVARLLREHADWLERSDAKEILPVGEVVHEQFGTVHWERQFDSY
jgi:hypothetical protein